MTKRKIVLFSGIGASVAGAIYLSYTTSNPFIATIAPTILIFAICPAMGVAMWLFQKHRLKK